MRLSRYCFKKLRLVFFVGFACLLFVVFLALQNASTNDIQAHDESSSDHKSTKRKAGSKNWEWSEDNLRDFMQMLRRDVAKNDKGINLWHSNKTNIEVKYPSISNYLPYIQDEQSALRPGYILSYREPSNKGNF